MVEAYSYRLYGLVILSDLKLPGVPECSPADDPDVRISVSRCAVPPVAYSFVPVEAGFQITIPRVGAYLICGGREIRIAGSAAATEDELRVWLLGSAIGALLHQRGSLPLHASAILVHGGCVAFVGPSGAGKSSLCAYLAQRGYEVMSDDVLAISRSSSGTLQAMPGSASLRLRADVLHALNLQPGELRGRGPCDDKYLLHRKALVQPLPLRSIYALEESPERGGGALTEVSCTAGLPIVLDNVYRPQFAHALGCFTRTFALSAAVAKQARVFRLLRPKAFRHMPAVLELLEAHWSAAHCQDGVPQRRGTAGHRGSVTAPLPPPSSTNLRVQHV